MKPKIGQKVTVFYRYWGRKGKAQKRLRTGHVKKVIHLDNEHFNLQIKVHGLFSFWHHINGHTNNVAIHGESTLSLNKLKKKLTEKKWSFPYVNLKAQSQ